MSDERSFLSEHGELTRRYFLQLGTTAAAFGAIHAGAHGDDVAPNTQPPKPEEPKKPAPPKPVKKDKAGAQPDPYFTPVEAFRDVSRGKPTPHRLPEEKLRAVGMTRDTWQLEIISDKAQPARLVKTFTKADGTAFDFNALMKLAEKHAVRFAKVMTCLNLGCPLGMGLWEGVPLREVVWLTQPHDNLRRVFFYGYHNDDPGQMFKSSLPIGRVLEDPYDLPPVILCYKLNGEWLNAERGGPVRIVVPEAYGFKSIKWLSHLVLTNLFYANDTYGEQNNDVDSPLKTFSAMLSLPNPVKPNQPIAISGYAQVGQAGLAKVQVAVESKEKPRPADDPYFLALEWRDAQVLPAPEQWSGLSEGKIPPNTHGFTAEGRPKSWPMRLTNAHWAAMLPGLPVGEYMVYSRTIDEKGNAQPMPRPFRKSGHAAIEGQRLFVAE